MKSVIKKPVAIILMLAMILCLAACGNTENKIQDALQGSWGANWTALGKNISRYYTFNGEKYTTGGMAITGELDTETGSYEIQDSVIHLIPDDGSEANDLDYSYNESTGTVILWWSDGIQLIKIN